MLKQYVHILLVLAICVHTHTHTLMADSLVLQGDQTSEF